MMLFNSFERNRGAANISNRSCSAGAQVPAKGDAAETRFPRQEIRVGLTGEYPPDCRGRAMERYSQLYLYMDSGGE